MDLKKGPNWAINRTNIYNKVEYIENIRLSEA